MTISVKHSILDVWQGSDYASGLLKLLCCGSKRDTPENWYMPNIYICSKLRIFPYSKVRHAKEKAINHWIWCFLCFALFFFIWLSQTIRVINRNDMCYFLHASNSGGMCWHVHLRLHTSNEDCHWVTKGKKCFNLL